MKEACRLSKINTFSLEKALIGLFGFSKLSAKEKSAEESIKDVVWREQV